MIDISKVITSAHQDVDFGTVSVFIKKHEGEIATIDAQKIFTHKVKDNTEALQIPIGIFKAMKEALASGNVTFTVTFHEGTANKVMVQDTKHHTSKEWG